MWNWREIRDGIVIIGSFLGIIIVVALLMVGCGGDGGDGDAAEILEANGLPTTSIDCSGGDVTVTGGDGPITATGGDGGDCGNVAAPEEDGDDGFPDTGEVPPFLGA